MRKVTLIIFTLLIFNFSSAQNLTSEDYNKKEVYITMRDGVKLFTSIYTPKDTSIDYPVLLSRTTYSCQPYGEENIPDKIMYNTDLVAMGYIFIFQDVRGRWMSEGLFENTKPPYSFWDSTKTDEVTDSWDTFEWITKNVEHFNGNIGVHGNSYLGWTTLTAAVANHPSVKAVLAMAPVTNFYFEDFTRYGLIAINYLPILDAFGIQKSDTTRSAWYSMKNDQIIDKEYNLTYDYYDFFLNRFTLKNNKKAINSSNFFWNNLMSHPNYDKYRKERNWLQYLENINCQILIAGGWNDEQNLFGILNSFKTINEKSPNANVKLLMGPWAHSHPKFREHEYYLGDIFYGYDLSANYHKDIQVPYFEYYLKGKGQELDFKTRIFDTGKKKWVETDENWFNRGKERVFYLENNGILSPNKAKTITSSEYISDPFHPVPLLEENEFYHIAPKFYMTDDQRFVSKRPDVLSFYSEPFEDDFTVLGEPKAFIEFETDKADADIYVKIIDVYPLDRVPEKEDKPNTKMNGYQQLVRMGYIRGRFREDFSSPKPFTSGQKTIIQVPLLEIFHTFKKGHRMMIQIQSSNFPLFDLNPQNYIENIYDAERKDFIIAKHKVYSDSRIVLPETKMD